MRRGSSRSSSSSLGARAARRGVRPGERRRRRSISRRRRHGRRPGRGRGAGRAFDDRASGLEVEGAGTVERLLADDEEGSRHQRFILRMASGQTVLVAHNIDVAPRVAGLRVGDVVGFRGVYEWSRQGGTVHWTHHDPSGDHAAGWLRHGGRVYR